MARLPDSTALGPLPSAASGRPMASIDASGYAKGAAAMAAGVERLGRGIASLGSSITAADNKAKADQDSLELANANSQYSIAKLDTAAGASPSGGNLAGGTAAPAAVDPYNPSEEVDTAPVTGGPTPSAGAQPTTQGNVAQVASPGAAPTDSSLGVSGATPTAPDQSLPQQEVHAPTSYARPLSANSDIEAKTNAFRAQRDQFAQGITDPLVRQKWVLNSNDDVERYRLGLMKQARSTERDNRIAYARDNQNAVISRAIETGDEGARAAGIRGQIDVVDALVANKFMTAQQGQKWKEQFRNDYGTAIGLASERKGPDAVNKTISELEQASFNAGHTQPQQGQSPSNLRPSVGGDGKQGYNYFQKRGVAPLQENQVVTVDTPFGAIKANPAAANDAKGFFTELAENGAPIQKFGSYNYRPKRWGGGFSSHAHGTAWDTEDQIDLTPAFKNWINENPQRWEGLKSKWNMGQPLPEKDPAHIEWVGPKPGDAPQTMAAAPGAPVKMASLSNGQTATDASGGPIPQQTGAQPLPGGDGQVAVMADQPTGVASPGDLGQAPGGQTGQPFQVAQAQRHPTIYDAMDPLPRERLLKQMYGVRDAMTLDESRRMELEKKKAAAASDKTEADMLKDLYGDNPTVTAKAIVNSDVLTREAKERMIGVATRANKPDPLSQVSHDTTMSLLDRARRPDGDPSKLTTLQPVYDAFINEKLNRTDFEFIRKEFNDMRTPEGESLSVRKQQFIKSIKQSIDESNPLMGKLDPSGSQQMYQFEIDLDRKVQEYRAAGKNPYDLLDPSKPDFMGKPEALSPYQKTLQQSLRDQANRMTGAPGAGSKVPTVAPAPQKNPNESIADYLKRTGKQ